MNIGILSHKIIKNRIGLLNLAEELGDVSKACRILGYSRDTFYESFKFRDLRLYFQLRNHSLLSVDENLP